MEITAYKRAEPIVETIEKFQKIKDKLKASNPSIIVFGHGDVELSSLDFSFKEIVSATIAEVDKKISYYEAELKTIN